MLTRLIVGAYEDNSRDGSATRYAWWPRRHLIWRKESPLVYMIQEHTDLIEKGRISIAKQDAYFIILTLIEQLDSGSWPGPTWVNVNVASATPLDRSMVASFLVSN